MFEELLGRVAQALDACGIPYMVIGGQAVLLYGAARMTQDIDITLGIAPDELPAILRVVERAGLQVLAPFPAEFVAATYVLPAQDVESGIRVDLIFSCTPFERDAISRAKKVPVDGVLVAYATPEDLVIHKVFAGRPRDMEDIRTILLKCPKLNRAYIREWLGVMSEGAEISFLERFDAIES